MEESIQCCENYLLLPNYLKSTISKSSKEKTPHDKRSKNSQTQFFKRNYYSENKEEIKNKQLLEFNQNNNFNLNSGFNNQNDMRKPKEFNISFSKLKQNNENNFNNLNSNECYSSQEINNENYLEKFLEGEIEKIKLTSKNPNFFVNDNIKKKQIGSKHNSLPKNLKSNQFENNRRNEIKKKKLLWSYSDEKNYLENKYDCKNRIDNINTPKNINLSKYQINCKNINIIENKNEHSNENINKLQNSNIIPAIGDNKIDSVSKNKNVKKSDNNLETLLKKSIKINKENSEIINLNNLNQPTSQLTNINNNIKNEMCNPKNEIKNINEEINKKKVQLENLKNRFKDLDSSEEEDIFKNKFKNTLTEEYVDSKNEKYQNNIKQKEEININNENEDKKNLKKNNYLRNQNYNKGNSEINTGKIVQNDKKQNKNVFEIDNNLYNIDQNPKHKIIADYSSELIDKANQSTEIDHLKKQRKKDFLLGKTIDIKEDKGDKIIPQFSHYGSEKNSNNIELKNIVQTKSWEKINKMNLEDKRLWIEKNQQINNLKNSNINNQDDKISKNKDKKRNPKNTNDFINHYNTQRNNCNKNLLNENFESPQKNFKLNNNIDNNYLRNSLKKHLSDKGYFKIDSLSDDQLLELANYYLATDESLEFFKSKFLKQKSVEKDSIKLNNMKAKIEYLNSKSNSKINNNHNVCEELSNISNLKVQEQKRNINLLDKSNYIKELKYISDGKEVIACLMSKDFNKSESNNGDLKSKMNFYKEKIQNKGIKESEISNNSNNNNLEIPLAKSSSINKAIHYYNNFNI